MHRHVLFVALLALLVVPIAEAAPESLASDGRVAVVADRQGFAFVRPAGRRRWTPLTSRGLLFPGDRVRTETRGANALDLRLQGGARLTVGPGSLLDVRKDGSLDLLAGEVEALGTPAAPLTVRGGDGAQVQAEAATWLKAVEGKLQKLAAAPRWLTGYRANTSDEWMGALITTIDGREVPLSVGYHKVDVEIRDQVARTTIEESFVNATAARLEGVFRFPLPAEASISGFGMWIGNELVEADIVERERARQIYEDILRRKKDPGLLEWAGGNVFQARVFPIEPHSEKRIRLVYTEVLPLEGATWRYRYALRSELLRQRPLRELALTVRAVSTAGLAEVTCPTHAEATVTADAHTALVELSQRDVSPEKDFEVAGKLAATDGLTVVAHRRGEDGWFLLLVQPPDTGSTAWQRDLVPEGKPLDLILAVDTSGSIDEAARKNQTTFVTALLGLLGPEDRVRVATIDTETRWMADAAKPADPDTVDQVLRFLDARAPMGWTDLDGAFDALLKAAGESTQVLYLGDGIGTSGDGDPVALAQRLKQKGAGTRATFHAVAPASTYEKAVLDAVASLGGGSVRALNEDPAGVAQRLLTEAALPLVRNLKVEIQGVPTARVYPAVLPNLPLGAQQTVLGRFLPSQAGTKATAIVTGTLEGKPVRFTSPIVVPGDQEGNSFLPRLWARRHLDALLAQGDAAAVKDEVVRFSTEYGILTPYTSLLVLENDEDREKYGVERRVHARDGEAEFASARDKVSLEVARKAAQEARTWRVNLRRQMLRQIARLGRDLPLHAPEVAIGDVLGEFGGQQHGDEYSEMTVTGGGGGGSAWGAAKDLGFDGDGESFGAPEGAPALAAAAAPSGPATMDGGEESESLGEGDKAEEKLQNQAGGEEMARRLADDEPMDDARAEVQETEDFASSKKDSVAGRRSRGYGFTSFRQGLLADMDGDSFLTERIPPFVDDEVNPGTLGFPPAGRATYDPPLPPEPPVADGAVADLLRKALGGGGDETLRVRIGLRGESLHPLRQVPRAPWTHSLLRSPERWFLRREAQGQEPTERSLDGDVVTSLSAGTRLARAWKGGPEARWTLAELRRLLGYPDAYAIEGARITSSGGPQQILLEVTRPPSAQMELWTLDAVTGALRMRESYLHNDLQGRTLFLDHVDVGGTWWARRTEQYDARGRLVSRTALAIEDLDAATFDSAFVKALAGREDVLTLGPDLPKVRDARTSLAQGKAGFADRIVLALDRLHVGRHDEAWTHLDAALAPLTGKPGVPWIRAALLTQTRRGEDLRRLLLGDLLARAAAKPELGWPLAQRIASLAGSLGGAERLALLDALETAWTAAGKDSDARWAWSGARVDALQGTSRHVEARALISARAAERPWSLDAVGAQANALAAGDPDAGWAYLAQAIVTQGPWDEGERDALEVWRSDRMLQRRLPADLTPLLKAWTMARPDSQEAWQRYVSSLYLQGKDAEADAWVEHTLSNKDQPPEEERTDPRELRAWLDTAVNLALGQGWNWWSYRLPVRFREPLAALARALLAREDALLEFAQRLVNEGRLTGTDPGRALHAEVRAMLLAPGAIETLPIRRLQVLVHAVPWNQQAADAVTFEAAVAALLARAKVQATPGERAALAELALHVLAARGENERAPDVLRAWRDLEQSRARFAVEQRLFQMLLSLKHDTAREDEAFALVPRLLPEERPKAWRLAQAGSLLRALTQWSLDGRARALLGTPEEQAARTRAQAREAEAKARREARTQLAVRLQGTTWPEPATHWAMVERLALVSENRESLDEVAREALAVLGLDFWPDVEGLPEDHPLTPVLAVLRSRAALLMSHAATRRGAPETIAAQALTTFEARWADERHDWRFETFRLLVALDRVEDLRKTLAAWLAAPDPEPRWRKALAYLEAELGHLAPAIENLEALKGVEGALSYGDWTSLASWLLAQSEDQRREAAIRASFEALDEWRISQRLQQELNNVQRRGPGVPGDLDPTVLPAIHVLLSKSAWPQNHWWVVQALYQATKDHRVLAGLVHGVIGHSAQGSYGFLQQFASLVGQVHEEATLDTLRAAIAERQRTASGADRRPLALLAALVEVRASQVLLKDPGPARRAGQAFEAAAALPLEPGELRPLVAFVSALPFSPETEIAKARVAFLERLATGADVASGDRLVVARSLAAVLWSAKQQDAALDRLDAARREAAVNGDPRTVPEVEQAFQVEIEWLATLQRFGAAETLLVAEHERGRSALAREGALVRLFHLWARGLKQGGTFQVGRGVVLYREAAMRMEAAWAAQPHLGPQIHGAHVELGKAAREGRALDDAGRERTEFASNRLPALLVGLPPTVASMTEAEAQALAELAGPRAALRFLLTRARVEPRFFERIGQDVWAQNLWRLGEWRAKGEPLGDLDAPMLAFVVQHLSATLAADERNAAPFWQSGNSSFWAAKVPEFVAATLAASEAAPMSPTRQYVCGWTLHVMGRSGEAIGVLQAALGRQALGREGRLLLLDLLLYAKRHAEALTIVDGLIAETPQSLDLHEKKAQALAGLNRAADAVAALQTGLDRLPGAKPPPAQLVGRVAMTAARLDLHAAAVGWFEDALRRSGTSPRLRHVRAEWRGWLASSLAGLGRFDEAVDAAAASVVGTDQQPRLDVDLDANPPVLERTILRAPDFAAFVARYEARVAASGADAPLIRKALARVARKRRDVPGAIHHLEVLRALAPNDAMVLQALVVLYGESGDAEKSRAALEALVRIDPGNAAAWEDLGNRLAKAGQAGEAERAYTSPIEARPLEPDGHRLLARVRTAQGRPDDAATRWAQVTRLRPLEPEARLEEAKAWIAAAQPARARAPLEQVLAGTWEERFGDVKAQAARLLAELK